jgi:Domain of unknown function (DUF6745)
VITKLTPQQQQRLVEFREEWIAVGCDCSPADRPAAEGAIAEMYARMKQPKPGFRWFESPKQAALEIKRLANSPDAVWRCRWGQQEVAWISFYTFCEEIGVKYTGEQSEALGLWRAVGQSCNWWWPMEGVCFLSERPRAIHWDERGRLHNADRKAVEYPDGWGVYSWHGTRVPARVIEDPDSYTAKELAGIRNTEHTRAIAEKLGWAKYLDKLGTKVIDEWTDPHTGLQYRLLDPKVRHGELQPRFIQKQSSILHDNSQPIYLEPVHPGLRTAASARKFQALAAFVDNDERELEQLMHHCNEDPELVYTWER